MFGTLNLLGSTGSVGRQTLTCAERLGIRPAALAANRNIGLLSRQARTFLPDVAVTAAPDCYRELRLALADTPVKVAAGPQAVLEAAAWPGGDITLNAIVGIAGLRPSMVALEAGKPLALANKESLVAGGAFVMAAAQRCGTAILPVDSEHSAIFQCLRAADGNAFDRLILTASGGPFFGKTAGELRAVTPNDALRHPTYQMGAKISVDSATLMNKGLELIEAMWLFGAPPEQIEVVVHPQSVVHSAVAFCDGAVIAQMGRPDMALPIQYALTYPERRPMPSPPLDLAALGRLTFFEPDGDAFPCLAAALRAARLGGCAPAVLNGANEAAVAAFLAGHIGFLQIGEWVWRALEAVSLPLTSLDGVFEADAAAREAVARFL